MSMRMRFRWGVGAAFFALVAAMLLPSTGRAQSTAAGLLALSATSYHTVEYSGYLVVTVTRSGGSTGAVSVRYGTVNGNAVAGQDFAPCAGMLAWADGDLSGRDITIPLLNPAPYLGTKMFFVTLSLPGGGAILGVNNAATATIVGNELVGAFSLSQPYYTAAQSAGYVNVAVNRTGGETGAASVNFTTIKGNAVAGQDFVPSAGMLAWADGDTSGRIVTIPLLATAPYPGSKTFFFVLSSPTEGATLGTNSAASIVITGTPAAPTPPVGTPSPVSGNAAKLLSYLAGLDRAAGQRVLSGQHASIWNADVSSITQPMDVIDSVLAETGQSPAILGLVLNYATNSYAYSVAVTDTLANQWWSQGGLVMLSLYDNDPTFSYNSTGAPIGMPIPAAAFHALTDKTSAAYAQWHAQLDIYAAALHTLTDSGNVVLFRPFIELNGGWNWYGAENPADFVAVWQDMHDYLMNTKGLANVLWIYNVNSSVGRYLDYYPGASYVDVVGMDVYDYGPNIAADADSGGMYANLVATGKPLIMPEIGLSPPPAAPAMDTVDDAAIIDVIQASLPNVVGFVTFNGGWAIGNQLDPLGLMNNPWVINLENAAQGH